MYGFYLIAVLVVVGGVIAYIGDQIGRHIGRRRLTLLGLRPRHTSFIVTVVTGVCIVAASIATLTWLSNDVRTALFHMREIQSAYAESLAAYEESQAQLEELRYRVEHHEEYLQEIIAARDAAAAETRRLQVENAMLEDDLAQAHHDLENWKRQVTILQRQSEELADDILKMEATRAEMQRQIAALTQELGLLEGQMRQGQFAFLKGDIVYAQVFEVDGPRAEVETRLLEFLEQADEAAVARGALIDGKNSAIELAAEEHFFQTVDVLTEGGGRWVVRAVATQNTVAGEPLLIHFHLFPETEPLYRQGDIIAEKVIDGGNRDVEGQVLQLLEEVNQLVLQEGMITGEDGSVGELPSEQFVDAVVQLRRIGGPAKVQVRAEVDTWITEGPLKVSIQVEGANSR